MKCSFLIFRKYCFHFVTWSLRKILEKTERMIYIENLESKRSKIYEDSSKLVTEVGQEDSLRNKKYWIWLSLIKNLGSKKKQLLLEKFELPENIYHLNKKELMNIQGIGGKIADCILDINIKAKVQEYIKYMEENNIKIININDKEYPNKLKEIYDPPISLYIKGNKEVLNNHSIGIVGCRDCTEYGKKAAKYFGYNLAKDKINVVSGLARGIDSYSHIGAIASRRNNNCSCWKWS